MLAVLVRQQYVINMFFWIATSAPKTWPLRWTLGKVYHFGGMHVGSTLCASAWFVVYALTVAVNGADAVVLGLTWAIVALLVVMIFLAVPSRRARLHDVFERSHRFCGWAILVLFCAQSLTMGGFVGSPSFWALLIIVISVLLPWLRLRRVPVKIVRPSSHVALVTFNYGVTPFAGSSTSVSRSPLLEWHSFANVPAPGRSGFRLTISRAGDWTGALIDDMPTHVWVKGIPTAGVGNIDKLFTRVVWVATGSGIGPCLPHLLSGDTPSRLVWSTWDPRLTYGNALVDEILGAQPDAVVWTPAATGSRISSRWPTGPTASSAPKPSSASPTRRPRGMWSKNWKPAAYRRTAPSGTHEVATMDYQTLDVVSQAGITTLTINRPQARNALSRLAQDVTRLFEQIPMPVIACVDGYALGGGCEMALACDFVYATSKAVFGQPEVRLGLIPGFGGCVRLQRRVGAGRAREMIYSGRSVDAAEAHRIGLVNQLFDTPEEMLAAATRTLAAIAANSASAVALCKATINGVGGLPVDSGLDIELAAFRDAFTTPDMREGTAAFLAKRKPVFER